MTIITGAFPFAPSDNPSIAHQHLMLQARLLVAESKVALYESALQVLAAQGHAVAQVALTAPLDLDAQIDGGVVEVDSPALPFERPRFASIGGAIEDDDPNSEPKFTAEFSL